jgi:formate hydrogenlyase subunit 3/multisubunit Na+/H+ antiporter MnhD subunit
MKLLQAYLWLRLIPLFSQSLIAGGLVMIAFGGVLAWAQGSFSRLLACAVFVEVGCLLLNLGSASQAGAEAVAFSLPARALALGTFGLGVWRLRAARNSDDFVAVRGLRDVWGGFALGIGGLSLAGLPGTLGFVSRWLTIQAYGLSDPESLALLSFAQISIGVGLVRGLSAMFQQSDPELVGDLSRSETLDLGWANRIPVYPARTPATAPTVIGIVGIVNPLSDVLSRLRQQFDERLPVAAGAVALVVLGLWPEPLAWLAKAAAQHFLFSP